MVEVNGRILNKDVFDILLDIRHEITNGKLSVIRKSGQSDVQITCPWHKDGLESRPSCYVRRADGVSHCFTCGTAAPFQSLVASCMGCSEDEASKWLVSHYGGDYTKREININYVSLENNDNEQEEILPESILNTFESYHPYMTQRKLSDEIINKFEIKYDPNTECVVFPVRDEHGNLIGLTKRKIKFKRYELPRFKNKPVYLLYKILEEQVKNVVVCESQINSLYLWSLGIPSIALFGTGTKYQYNLLRKSGIKYYTLCLDGDDAGHKGAERFKKALGKYSIIEEIEMPNGKDINDYEPEVVKNLFNT